MNKKITALFLAVLTIALLTACGNDDNNPSLENNNNDNVNDNTENVEEDNTNEMNNEEESESVDDADVDHQTELSFAETGTVITGDNAENYRVEITPESVEYTDEYEDEHGEAEPWEEIFVKYTATIKNTDDKPFPISQIRIPSLATWENETDDFVDLNHQRAAFDEEIYLDDEKVTPEDEIAPGEEITVISIFDTDEVDKYYLQYGQGGEQIVTYAQWIIEAADFE